MNKQYDESLSPNDADLKRVTPHLLAVAMLQNVLENNKWKEIDPEVVSRTQASLPLVCEFFQLRIFLDTLNHKFGSPLAALVESSFIAVTNTENAAIRNDFFSKVMNAIASARRMGPAKDGPSEESLRVDCQVADQTLKLFSESEEDKRTLRPLLAASLSYARIWAEMTFPEVVAGIEFDPASIAFVRLETRYRGRTNRWRLHPGHRERHLQRMEGNALFQETKRNPTNLDIEEARAADDAEVSAIADEMNLLFEEIKAMGEDKEVPASTLIDVAQYKLQPLMVRSAEMGELPQAVRYLDTLKAVGEGLLKSLPLPEKDLAKIRDIWIEATNPLNILLFSESFRLPSVEIVPALLCESTEDVETIVNTLLHKHPELYADMSQSVALLCELAEIDSFEIPDRANKLSFFATSTPKDEPKVPQKRHWWKLWP